MDSIPHRQFSPNDVQSIYAIEVPQGCFGIAKAPYKNTKFITTSVAQCVAVALVGYGDDSTFPVVNLAHLDHEDLAARSIKYLYNGFTQAVRSEDTCVYILNGDHQPPILDPVVSFFKDKNMEGKFLEIHDCQCASLSIDLRNGNAHVTLGHCPLRTYVPNNRANEVFFSYLFSGRAENPVYMETGYPIARAFHLSNGIPEFYCLKNDHAPRSTTGPSAQPR